jgi:hypothetical protein
LLLRSSWERVLRSWRAVASILAATATDLELVIDSGRDD